MEAYDERPSRILFSSGYEQQGVWVFGRSPTRRRFRRVQGLGSKCRVCLERITEDGIYEGVVEDVKVFDAYKFSILTRGGATVLKSDPYCFHAETRPGTASKFYELDGFQWTDGEWLKNRKKTNIYESPVNIYEVHAGSWRRYEDFNFYSYKKLAEELITYVSEMGYTHLELMPHNEYPYEG